MILLTGLIVASSSTGRAEPTGHASDRHQDGWRVLEATGGARYRVPASDDWWPVRSDTRLPGGSRVVSEAGSSLILGRGGDTVRLGPRARVVLPSAALEPVEQQAGTVGFRVRPRAAAEGRFVVETPFAALVVKGTVFDVAVNEAGTEVAVDEGLVGVTSRVTGQTVDVQPGQRARQGSAPSSPLQVQAAPDAAFAAAPDAATPGRMGGTAVRAAAPASSAARPPAAANAGARRPAEPPQGVFARMSNFFRETLRQDDIDHGRGKNNGVRDHGRGVGNGGGQGKGAGQGGGGHGGGGGGNGGGNSGGGGGGGGGGGNGGGGGR